MEVILMLDCGGTSTEVLAASADADLSKSRMEIPELREALLSSGNFATIGENGISSIAEQALDFARASFDSISIENIRVVAGIAGVESSDMQQRCAQVFKGIGFIDPVILNDCDLLLKAQGDRGVAMIAGTGSNCFGRNGDKFFQDGGWGPALGGQGSGFQIGQLACFAAIALAAGRPNVQEASLLRAILDDIGERELRQLIGAVYGSSTKQAASAVIASFAPLVFAAAQEGDREAQIIIATSASEFAVQVANVCLKIEAYTPCIGQQGGIFSANGYDTFYHPHLVRVLNSHGIDATFKRFGKEPGEIDPLLAAARNLFSTHSH